VSDLSDARVVIIGAGPAGLAAASRLTRSGVSPVLVIDRDDAPGGLPRYCRHPGFGWHYTRRFESGPKFVRRLIRQIDTTKVRLLAKTTALGIEEGPVLTVTGPETGNATLRPEALILATGILERPRGGRLIPGDRPAEGVYSTGLLQQIETRGGEISSRRLVVVGSEHVSFSVLLTARRLGARVIALIEPGPRIRSFPVAGLAARVAFGAPVLISTRLTEIVGRDRVEAVVVEDGRGARQIACDGVVLTADWVADSKLAEASPLTLDAATGGPVIDQAMRTSLPGVFAAGNLLHPVEASGIAALEGERAGAFAASYLADDLPDWEDATPIGIDAPIRYLVPQRWAPYLDEPDTAPGLRASAQLSEDRSGRLVLRKGEAVLWQGRTGTLRAGRQLRPNLDVLAAAGSRLGAAPILGVEAT
jgi:thioredoxin reductase